MDFHGQIRPGMTHLRNMTQMFPLRLELCLKGNSCEGNVSIVPISLYTVHTNTCTACFLGAKNLIQRSVALLYLPAATDMLAVTVV